MPILPSQLLTSDIGQSENGKLVVEEIVSIRFTVDCVTVLPVGIVPMAVPWQCMMSTSSGKANSCHVLALLTFILRSLGSFLLVCELND